MASGLSNVENDAWSKVRHNFARIKHDYGWIPSPSGLTASRLLATDTIKNMVSSDLANWVAGTANEVDITDGGDGTITVGIVNPLIVAKGGTGVATLTDGGLLLGSGTGAVTVLAQATNGQLPIGSTGADPVLAGLTGTANQVNIANAAGSITFSTPQNIHAGAGPIFDTLTLSSIANEATDVDKFLVDSSGLIKYRTGTEVLSDIGASSTAHRHDTETLEHDAVNSNGGAFSFSTSGTVTFNQSIVATRTTTTDHQVYIRNLSNGASANCLYFAANNLAEILAMGMPSSLHSGTSHDAASSGFIYSNGAGGLRLAAAHASGIVRFYTAGSTSAHVRMAIAADGNIGIGTITPSEKLFIWSSTDSPTLFQNQNVHAGNSALASFQCANDISTSAGFSIGSSTFVGAGSDVTIVANGASMWANCPSGINVCALHATGEIGIFTGGNVAANKRINISAAGVTCIGDGGVTNYTQFLADGDLIFVGTAGLCYGGISAYDEGDTVTITATGVANKVQITTFDTNDPSNNTTPDHTNDHITITVAGYYFCTASLHIESAGGGGADEFGFAVYKNNGATLFENCHAHRELAGGGGDTGSVSISGIIDLAVNDTIEVWCWNEDSTDDLVVDDITLSLVQIAGT